MSYIPSLSLSIIMASWPLSLVTEAAENDLQLQLGGIRNVTSEIEERDDIYHIRVRFRRVKVFSAATNDRLNRAKGRGYALRSLTQHLVGKQSIHLSVSRARITNLEQQDSYVSLAISIPVRCVTLTALRPRESSNKSTDHAAPFKQPNIEKDGEQQDPVKKPAINPGNPDEHLVKTSHSELLARLPDYRDTIALLADTLLADLEILSASWQDVDSLVKALSQLQTQTSDNFVALSRKIASDRLLLSKEKRELLKQIETRVTKVLEAIADADATYEWRASAAESKPANTQKAKDD